MAELYLNNPQLAFPNFVLCGYQTPMFEHIPFNGVCMIFRQIYLWLNTNFFNKDKKKTVKEINLKENKLKNNNDNVFYGENKPKMLSLIDNLDKLNILK